MIQDSFRGPKRQRSSLIIAFTCLKTLLSISLFPLLLHIRWGGRMGSPAFQTPGLIWRCYTQVRIVSVVLRDKARKSGVEKAQISRRIQGKEHACLGFDFSLDLMLAVSNEYLKILLLLHNPLARETKPWFIPRYSIPDTGTILVPALL